MLITRRRVLLGTVGVAAAAAAPAALLAQAAAPVPATGAGNTAAEAPNATTPTAAVTPPAPAAAVKTADEWIAEFTGGAEAVQGDGVKLTAPEIAENGNTVPVSVEAPGATEILLVAPGNPTPGVARFKFGELAPRQAAATRIRLAKTQDVIAVARMADGTFVRASSNIKVTIGGCGG